MTEKITPVSGAFKPKQISNLKKQLQKADKKSFSGAKNTVKTLFSKKKKLFRKIIKKARKKAKKISEDDHDQLSEIIEILDKHKEKAKKQYENHPDDELEDEINRINEIMLTVLPYRKIPQFETYTFKKALRELEDFFLALPEINQDNFLLKKNKTVLLLRKAKTAKKRKAIIKNFIRHVKKITG